MLDKRSSECRVCVQWSADRSGAFNQLYTFESKFSKYNFCQLSVSVDNAIISSTYFIRIGKPYVRVRSNTSSSQVNKLRQHCCSCSRCFRYAVSDAQRCTDAIMCENGLRTGRFLVRTRGHVYIYRAYYRLGLRI